MDKTHNEQFQAAIARAVEIFNAQVKKDLLRAAMQAVDEQGPNDLNVSGVQTQAYRRIYK